MTTTLYTTTPTAGDDFLIAFTGSQTLDGGDGDDFILGDSFTPFGTGTSNSLASPYNIDNALAWTIMENPFFADSSVPHTSLYVVADAGQTHYSSVTVGAGQTLTVDIDFGNSHPIGVDTDLVVEIYNSSGTLVASIDDASTLLGGDGSLSAFDSFLTFTNTGGATETYTIRFREFGSGDGGAFEGGETFVANISVTGHAHTGAGGGHDTLSGGNGNDTIAGQAGDDALFGGTGDDTLIGGSGNDTLDGGDGLDRVSYASALAGVTVDLNATGAQNMGGAGMDTLISVEDVTGSAFNDRVIGSAANNNLIGGNGTDTVSYAAAAAGVTVSLGTGGSQDTVGAGIDRLSGFENLIGSAFADTLSGDFSANRIFGGGGDDTLNGGAGNDLLNGGFGSDTVSYAAAEAGVIVDLGASGPQQTGGGGQDTLISIERVVGSNFNDTLQGSASGDVLTGGDGNDGIFGEDGGDVAFGGLGTDTLVGGAGGDILFGDAGDDTVLGESDGDILFGDAGSDTISGGTGADIVFGGDGDDNVLGEDGDDIAFGDSGNDNVVGASGADILFGGDGLDTLLGGNDTDLLDGGLGDDTIDGGNGVDTASYGSAVVGVTVNLGIRGLQYTIGAGFDTLAHIENLTGSGLGDVLQGDGAGNVLTGNDGNDNLQGKGGNDTLDGGDNDDALVGGDGSDTASYVSAGASVTVTLATAAAQDTLGAGIDTLSSIENLTGSNHADTLTGNGARNVLDGGAGADKMTGGAGNDTYIVDNVGDKAIESSNTGGTDLVKSTVSFTLGARVENLTLLGSSAISGTGNGLANVMTGNAAVNVLIGAGRADTLKGMAGADTLSGGTGNDVLTGGTGGDRFLFDTALNANSNVDRISDFSAAADSIYLDLSVFSGISAGKLKAGAFREGTAAADASDRIIYDSATGRIFYDADGTGAGAKVLFARVTAGTTLTNADFIGVAATTSLQARTVNNDSTADAQTSGLVGADAESVLLEGEFVEPARMLDQQQWSQMQHMPGRLDWSSVDYFSA